MIDYLIVGSGVHGTCVALALLTHGVSGGAIGILDPHNEPLARWRERAAAVEMNHLRSPAIHHLQSDRLALLQYACSAGEPLPGDLVPPTVDLFERYTRDVVLRAGLRLMAIRGTAQALYRRPGGWCVQTEHQSIEARRLVLAIGSGEYSEWPEWACTLRRQHAPIAHVFDHGFRPVTSGSVAVIGGGLSAAHVTLAAAERGQPVTWGVRRPPTVSEYDADWDWFTGEAMIGFQRIRDPLQRRAIIDRNRHRGSVPPRVASRLIAAIADGAIDLVTAPLLRTSRWRAGIRLSFDGCVVVVDHVVLATGYQRSLPGADWLAPAAAELGLPRGPGGFPLVDSSLRWASGLYTTGALAELEVGPTARAIAGGQRAAQLIARDAVSR
jgi:hypothetical protein